MIGSIKAFFESRMQPEGAPASDETPVEHPPIQVAACALMLELAYSDDDFSQSERDHLEGVIGRHFGLDDETTDELIEHAHKMREQAIDLFQFTSLVASGYSEAQKMVLLEAMWGLVFADGEVAKHETAMMRRVSKLLDVRPGFLADARKRAESTE
jgi:uncharacterized tellurite resistance protein B-like protein